MTKDETDVVLAVREALAGKVGRERYELWFGTGARLALEHGTLVVNAPNRFFLDWIRQNFRGQIEDACTQTLGECPALEFRIDPTLDVTRTDAGAPGVAAPARRGASPADRAPASLGAPGLRLAAIGADDEHPAADETFRLASADAAGNRATDPARDASPPIAMKAVPVTFDSFVTGQTNRLAFASAEMAAKNPGRMTPLLIHGPTGVGKTHLLRGIWASARRTRRDFRAIYLSAEQFTSGFLEALRGSGLPSFRAKIRGVELLVLDDLHFLAGKRATQVELLHTIDELLREGRQLVFSADRSPSDLVDLGPELTARLQSGMVCPVEQPDYATRLGIVAQMARRLQISVSPDVQEYVAAQLTSHARELSGALCRLQATAQSTGQPITLAMAQEALTEMIRHAGRMVRLGDIEKAVCEVFGVDPAGLQSGRKDKSISHPRMLAMWLARKHTRAAPSEIGQYFGRRSHSTVISAQKRIDHWMANGDKVELANHTWNVDDAVRLVERRLRAC